MEDLEKSMNAKVEEFLSSPEQLKRAAPFLEPLFDGKWTDFVESVEKTLKAKGKGIMSDVKVMVKDKFAKYLGVIKTFVKKLGDLTIQDFIDAIPIIKAATEEYRAAEAAAKAAAKDNTKIAVTPRAWTFSKVVHTLLGTGIGVMLTLVTVLAMR